MNSAIIVAAGQGTRAGGARAKQFQTLAGVPVIIHTLRRFEQSATIAACIVVVPATETDNFLTIAAQFKLRKVARVVAGGATRTESVARGLAALAAEPGAVVAVHDGVRPFVTAAEIDRTVRAAAADGAAVLVAPVVDTIKEVAGARIARTLPRAELRRALTPQCFRFDLLRRACEHAQAHQLDATDCSALVEQLGVPVTTVAGDPRNIKLTRPEDFALAEILLQEFERK
ncbi:MAG TPA: 2-C-methyl-D-erythritol 4-phosphate cytidylyltransferase [Pyrinomonadaceae bacterium]|nr:2-C-methyl-D-erythritol 4-phosphate cytidylyltransferase [Pyrinomonadaceae bacterium]